MNSGLAGRICWDGFHGKFWGPWEMWPVPGALRRDWSIADGVGHPASKYSHP